MECRVEFDYMAQEPDELSIKKGEIIKNVITKMDGWYEGTLGGKVGVFPDNFVKIIEKPQPQTIEQPKPPSNKLNVSAEVVLRNNPNSQRRVKVLFSYAPEQDDELPLEVGEVLDFIEEVEEGWWRGKLKGREGIFPSNFVEEVQGEEPKSNGNLVDAKIEEISKPKDTSRSNQPKGIPDVVPVPVTSQNQSIVDDEPAPELPPKPVRELARCFYPYKASNEDELTLVEGDIITIISRNCEDEGWWRGEVRGKIGLFPDNFVRIITPGETQQPSVITGSQPKQVAQDRNINISSPNSSDSNIAKTKKDSIPGINTSVTDGCGISKINSDKDSSKVEQVKAKLGKSNSKEGSGPAIPPQAIPIAPKVGHAATSPISPGIAAFHNNLFSNQKPDAFARREPPVGSSAKDEKASDESEEFNSVERTETLNHLTANRAKAPKRRPPSAIITRENDGSLVNGSSHSYESSMAESPPPHHSTPINLSTTSNGTPSGSFVTATDGSSLNHSGSFLSQSRDKETSPIPTQPSANHHQTSGSGGITATKPKKQALPWMAELKQTQDKKRSSTSGPTTTPPPVTTNPPPKESTTATSTKAPPLPAKPSSLGSAEKVTNNLNHSAPTINSTYGLSNKNFPVAKKSPSSAPPPSSTHAPVPNHTSEIQRGDGDSNSNKAFVSYDDYAALKTRVTSLENEVETLKRQLKMFLDRELRSHIV